MYVMDLKCWKLSNIKEKNLSSGKSVFNGIDFYIYLFRL